MTRAAAEHPARSETEMPNELKAVFIVVGILAGMAVLAFFPVLIPVLIVVAGVAFMYVGVLGCLDDDGD